MPPERERERDGVRSEYGRAEECRQTAGCVGRSTESGGMSEGVPPESQLSGRAGYFITITTGNWEEAMKSLKARKALEAMSPCGDASKWVKDNPRLTANELWDACPRGDWMLWLIGKGVASPPWSDERKPLLACALDCAETVKHLWPKAAKKQITAAVNVLRKWIAGKATADEAKEAKRNLLADNAAADADARRKNQQQTADIVRSHFPACPIQD